MVTHSPTWQLPPLPLPVEGATVSVVLTVMPSTRGPGAAACYGEDTEGMDRGRAETHLRQLAEAELRRATAPGPLGLPGRLPLVAQALIAVGAVDVGTADQIQAELDLAMAARYQAAADTAGAGQAARGPAPPGRHQRSPRSGSHHGRSCAGQVIRIRDGEIRGELGLLAYLRTARAAGSPAGWMHGPAPGPDTQPPRSHLLVSASSPRPMTRAPATPSASLQDRDYRFGGVGGRARPAPGPAARDRLARPAHRSRRARHPHPPGPAGPADPGARGHRDPDGTQPR